MQAGGSIRQGIGSVISRIAVVPANPCPRDGVWLRGIVQAAPEVHVVHPPPALGHGLDDILALAVQRDDGRLPYCSQPDNRLRDFHAIRSRKRALAAYFLNHLACSADHGGIASRAPEMSARRRSGAGCGRSQGAKRHRDDGASSFLNDQLDATVLREKGDRHCHLDPVRALLSSAAMPC
jgi:hypothetical protein